MPPDDNRVREQVAGLDNLLGEVEALPDPEVRAKAMETVSALLDLYGEALARVMMHADRTDPALTRRLVEDELVSHLLLLHDLHPDDLETRVARALESVRHHLQGRGADVWLLSVTERVVRVHVDTATSSSSPSVPSGMTKTWLRRAIEDAMQDAAPDIERVEIEGVAQTSAPATSAAGGPAFVPLSALTVGGDGHGEGNRERARR